MEYMQDDITAMMGGVKTPEEERMAQALRARQQTGDTLALSTIGQASNLGQQIGQRTSEAAGRTGQYKQAGLERDSRASESALTRQHISSEQELSRAGDMLKQNNSQLWNSGEADKTRIQQAMMLDKKVEAARIAVERAHILNEEAKRLQEAGKYGHARAMMLLAQEFTEIQNEIDRDIKQPEIDIGNIIGRTKARGVLADDPNKSKWQFFLDSTDEDTVEPSFLKR